jgi:hypothetical protein
MSDSAAQRRPTKRRRISDVQLESASATPPVRCQHDSPSRGDVSNTRLDAAPLPHPPMNALFPVRKDDSVGADPRVPLQIDPHHSGEASKQASRQASQPWSEYLSRYLSG